MSRARAGVLAGVLAVVVTLGNAFTAANTVAASDADDQNFAAVAEDFDPIECDGVNGVTVTVVWQTGTPRPSPGSGELVLGGLGNDNLNGQGGADCIVGGAGNDTLDGGPGGNRDVIVGGDGNDTMRGGGGGDFLYGGNGDDTIDGQGGPDTLSGEDGNDTLNGGGGSDTLIGGNNFDTCTGGGGADNYDPTCEIQNP